MLSKQKISLINSLDKKKYRDQHQRYLLEGVKIVQTVLKANPETIEVVFLLPELWDSFREFESICETVNERELKKISRQKNPGGVMAIARMSEMEEVPAHPPPGLYVFLDGVQDPGNVGTIIRSCDWFGVAHLFLGSGCADLYNPKVIQSAMGSHLGVRVSSVDFSEILHDLRPDTILGADMEGADPGRSYRGKTLLCMGSEGRGLSEEVRDACTAFTAVSGAGDKIAESLNVSTVSAILLDRLVNG